MEKEAENLADIAEVLIINRVLCPNGDYKVRNLASFLQKILSLLAARLEKEREVEEAGEIDYNADGKLYR